MKMGRVSFWAPFLAVSVQAAIGMAQEDLFDPENPAASPADVSETIIDDPENTLGNPVESAVRPPATPPREQTSAEFLASYTSTGMVDTDWDPGEDVFENATWLSLRLDYGRDSLRAVAEVEFEHWWAFDEHAQNPRASYTARPGEAYVLWRSGNWSVGAGNMIHRWGVTDLARPADVINPVDLTVITPDRAQRRIPQLSAETSWGGTNWRVSGLLVPFFEPNRSWAFGRDTAAFSTANPAAAEAFPIGPLVGRLFDGSVQDDVQPALTATELPDETPGSMSAGGRLSGTFANSDVALGYFFGWDRTQSITIHPQLSEVLATVAGDTQFLEDLDFTGLLRRNPTLLGQLDELSESAARGEPLFEAKHERLHTVAAEFARYLGPVGTRLDVAFHPQKTLITRDFQSVRVPAVNSALGLSYEQLQDESNARLVSLEGYWNEPLEDDEYLILGRRQAGVSVAVQWTTPWLESRAVAISDLTNQTVILTTTLAHRIAPSLRVGAGFVAFETWGDDTSVTAARILDGNDFASITVDGNF